MKSDTINAKGREYCDTKGSKHGLMQCCVCGKSITEGEYRVHKKYSGINWRYVTTHRACCSGDPEWAKFDAQRQEAEERQRKFRDACIVFRDEWGINDLDHYIGLNDYIG